MSKIHWKKDKACCKKKIIKALDIHMWKNGNRSTFPNGQEKGQLKIIKDLNTVSKTEIPRGNW